MNINGYNPYRKGFDMMVADLKRNMEIGVITYHGIPAEGYLSSLEVEIRRLRKIEAAAVACADYPAWNDEQFYDLMIELQRALAA